MAELNDNGQHGPPARRSYERWCVGTKGGPTISQPGYNPGGWYPIAAPSTVLAGLVANNVYQNIYFGTNLKNVPDLTTQNW